MRNDNYLYFIIRHDLILARKFNISKGKNNL